MSVIVIVIAIVIVINSLSRVYCFLSLAPFSVLWMCIQPRPGTPHTNVARIWCLNFLFSLAPSSVLWACIQPQSVTPLTNIWSPICYLSCPFQCTEECGRAFVVGRPTQTLPAFEAPFLISCPFQPAVDVYSTTPWDAPHKHFPLLMPYLLSLAPFSVLWTCIQPRPGTPHTNVAWIFSRHPEGPRAATLRRLKVMLRNRYGVNTLLPVNHDNC